MSKHLIAMLLIATPAFAQDAPLPARVAAEKMTLPDGFKATLFAGEPDVVQPIAFCFDDRGRVWVAECLSYPDWQADPKKGKDRIVILEDTDGDGVHDKRTVFASNLQNLSGINYGFGGVWICSSPNLIFIPIKDGDKPGEPEIVLDGWSLQAKHNVFNSLTWGPDGWLYGCNGIIATSRVGRPGTPDKDRTPMNCGVWRYHPTKKKFEVVAHGTTNPWGLDFDEFGEMFITNCVIDHLWHIVPGGHYQRMYGEDLNPHVYKLMPSICDHLHWGGGSWTSSRHPLNKDKPKVDDSLRESKGTRGASAPQWEVHSAAGGGHAHVGCMIYLGDNWPERYRGGVFMLNLHGSRINHDLLERNGSTYVARHCKDFMLANDPWFRGISIHYGPDGGVYVSDWTDTGECHNYKIADRTNGRIFKITYGKATPWKGDLAKLSDLELVRIQERRNSWFAQHSRRILQERAHSRPIDAAAVKLLEDNLKDPHMYGQALWTLRGIDLLTREKLLNLLQRGEFTRTWAFRWILEDGPLDDKTAKLLHEYIEQETSPRARLHIAGAIPRLGSALSTEWKFSRRFLMVERLLRRQDSNDPYLPLMYWYALEPTLYEDSLELRGLMQQCQIPLVREFIARRCTLSMLNEEFKESKGVYDLLHATMLAMETPAFDRDYLRGISEGLSGRRKVAEPSLDLWKKLYPKLIESPLPEVRERALALAVQFGDERAFTLLRKIVPDSEKPLKERESALQALLFQQKADLVPLLRTLLTDDALRRPAIRGLAAYDDADAANLLIQNYSAWDADTRSDVMQTLSSRSKYAVALLGAVAGAGVPAKTKIPRGDINSFTIRQLQSLKSPEVAAKLKEVIGEVRPASADKAKLIAKYKAELKPSVLKNANLSNGRALYAKSCASCHRLFGEGSDIGPDLTGAQRMNLDYILENVLDPSAIVPREYQVTIIETKTGRTLSGMVRKESEAALTLQMPNEQVVIPKADIDTRTATKLSMMPEGIFEPLRIEDVRDLVAYLASPTQVALKK